jgi:hypothetical protein
MVMMRLTVALTILLLGGRGAEFQTLPFGGRSNLARLQSACRAALGVLSGPVLERLGGTLLFSPQVDGGGDGGGGDGGGGDGDGGDGAGTSGGADGNGGAGTSGDGSTGGDTGTGEGNSGDSDSNGDGPGADPGDQGDPGSTEDAPANEAEAPPDPSAATDPTDPSTVSTINAEPPSVPTNDPALGLRGPGSSGADVPDGVGTIGSVGVASPVSSGLASVVDVGINAVIVSGARTPWEAVGRSSGVRNVIVKGGIIALGETALPTSAPGVTVGTAENPPEWLKFQPDLRYLNGSVFPPVVPNVIDIRTISYTEEVIENSSK